MVISKGYLQCYLTHWICRLTRHHSMENSRRRLKIFVSQIHTTKGLIVKDIDTAASIHEHLREIISSYLWSNHQCQLTWIVNPGREILSAP